MLNTTQLVARVKSLRERSIERDVRSGNVLAVRTGKISSVYPDFFPDGVDSNVVANFVDVVARDLSETIAPLPAINCSAANQASDAARAFADKRTRIAVNYFLNSDLSVHMYNAADWYITYGFLPFVVELDHEAGLPRIRPDNPRMAYPEYDRYGRCIAYAKVYQMSIAELIALYPEWEGALLGPKRWEQNTSSMLEVVRYYDKEQSVVYVPERQNLVLSKAANPIGKMMVVVAQRPSLDGEARGQFDDVLGIQMMRNRFAMLAMEAAEKAIQAPIVVPQDVQELVYGGDAIIRTANPQGVRRVAIEVPQTAFAEGALLKQEMQTGTRYPESRTGNISASVVTGQGVQALMGAFDTQIKSAQAIFAASMRDVIKMCFEIDEKLFNVKKTIRGVDSGSPFEIDYTPGKDIKGDYSADVSYGILAGLNPAQGLIFLLQAKGGDFISTDRAMRELPFSINVTVEQEKIDIEKMRNSLLGALDAMAQAIPAMSMQGQDPSDTVRKIALAISERQKGKTLEEVVAAALAPVAPPPPSPQDALTGGIPGQEPASPAPDQGAPVGGPPQGPGVPPSGQAPPPDLMTMLTRATSGGAASSSIRTSKQIQH